jgi:glutamate synthase domain-containing protein 2/rubredoxin
MTMARYLCSVCGYEYDEASEGGAWSDLPDDWECPICGASKDYFEPAGEASEVATAAPGSPEAATSPSTELEDYLAEWRRSGDGLETALDIIQRMSTTGESIIEPMRTTKPVISWDEILIKGAQLARMPRNADEQVSTRTVIGPKAARPLVIETPIYVSHMSFGALSREVKLALAQGSAAVETAMCSGEGGILPESMESSSRYIFEYVPNLYSVSEENLRNADAIEIKIGQSVKPGMGGHLPAKKVTDEIAAIRGFPAGQDIISPARFEDIADAEQLKSKVAWLRDTSNGRPVGVKLAAGHIENDLAVALTAEPDFITIDGRAGATGAASKVVKDACSVPTIFALHRARRFLDDRRADGVSLVITGGLRISSDFAKALALGADAVAIATAALIACGCQQYRICHTGRCPVGITTQDPDLRSRLDVEISARRLENFLRASTRELADFARLCGHDDVHGLELADLLSTNSEIVNQTGIQHAGQPDRPV